MLNKYLITVFITLSVSLAGCSQSHQQTINEEFGDSIKTNTAMQVINPDAGQEDMPPMALDGQKAETGLTEYRKDTGEAGKEDLVKDIGNE